MGASCFVLCCGRPDCPQYYPNQQLRCVDEHAREFQTAIETAQENLQFISDSLKGKRVLVKNTIYTIGDSISIDFQRDFYALGKYRTRSRVFIECLDENNKRYAFQVSDIERFL